MSKELQKDEYYLRGGLGAVNGRPITKYVKDKDSVTITISPIQAYVNEGLEQFGDLPKTEDADFEIITPKQIEK